MELALVGLVQQQLTLVQEMQALLAQAGIKQEDKQKLRVAPQVEVALQVEVAVQLEEVAVVVVEVLKVQQATVQERVLEIVQEIAQAQEVILEEELEVDVVHKLVC